MIHQNDVTPLMDAYRDCARHLWNCYFAKHAEPGQDWDLRDEFDVIAVGLFRSLVLRKLGREDAAVLPDHIVDRQPLLFLRFEVPVGSVIHINRTCDRTSGYWDDPVNRVEADALDLRFSQYFDWWDLGFRDFAYYKVRIVDSRPHPQLVGRDALLPIGPGVKVIHEEVG